MISKRVYLLLTAGLILLSIGTGFATQERKSHQQSALQSLQAANLRLDKMKHKTSAQLRSQALVREAIQVLESESGG